MPHLPDDEVLGAIVAFGSIFGLAMFGAFVVCVVMPAMAIPWVLAGLAAALLYLGTYGGKRIKKRL